MEARISMSTATIGYMRAADMWMQVAVRAWRRAIACRRAAGAATDEALAEAARALDEDRAQLRIELEIMRRLDVEREPEAAE